jgi:hypothetical protein
MERWSRRGLLAALFFSGFVFAASKPKPPRAAAKTSWFKKPLFKKKPQKILATLDHEQQAVARKISLEIIHRITGPQAARYDLNALYHLQPELDFLDSANLKRLWKFEHFSRYRGDFLNLTDADIVRYRDQIRAGRAFRAQYYEKLIQEFRDSSDALARVYQKALKIFEVQQPRDRRMIEVPIDEVIAAQRAREAFIALGRDPESPDPNLQLEFKPILWRAEQQEELRRESDLSYKLKTRREMLEKIESLRQEIFQVRKRPSTDWLKRPLPTDPGFREAFRDQMFQGLEEALEQSRSKILSGPANVTEEVLAAEKKSLKASLQVDRMELRMTHEIAGSLWGMTPQFRAFVDDIRWAGFQKSWDYWPRDSRIKLEKNSRSIDAMPLHGLRKGVCDLSARRRAGQLWAKLPLTTGKLTAMVLISGACVWGIFKGVDVLDEHGLIGSPFGFMPRYSWGEGTEGKNSSEEGSRHSKRKSQKDPQSLPMGMKSGSPSNKKPKEEVVFRVEQFSTSKSRVPVKPGGPKNNVFEPFASSLMNAEFIPSAQWPPRPDEYFLGERSKRDLRVVQVLPSEDERKLRVGVTLQSLRPLTGSEDGYLAIPSPEEYEISKIRVWNRDGPVKGRILLNQRTGRYGFELATNHIGQQVYIQAEFLKKSDSMLLKIPGPAIALSPQSLRAVKEKLNEAGFTQIADGIEAAILKAEREQKPITLQSVASVVAETSVYENDMSRSPPVIPVGPQNPFLAYSLFCKKGVLYGQCDTGNKLMELILKEIFRGTKEIEVRQASLAIDRGAGIVYPFHANTEIFFNGVLVARVDATPKGYPPRVFSFNNVDWKVSLIGVANPGPVTPIAANRPVPMEPGSNETIEARYRRLQQEAIEAGRAADERAISQWHSDSFARLAKQNQMIKKIAEEDPVFRRTVFARGLGDERLPPVRIYRENLALLRYFSGEITLRDLHQILCPQLAFGGWETLHAFLRAEWRKMSAAMAALSRDSAYLRRFPFLANGPFRLMMNGSQLDVLDEIIKNTPEAFGRSQLRESLAQSCSVALALGNKF